MKTFIPALICLIISITNGISQNYQTINSKRIAYFDNQYNNIKCIRIDSVKFQNDSIMFPFAEIKVTENGCFSPYLASWIGKKVIIEESGFNYFFNKNSDTIKINTNAKAGDKWIVFQIIDSLTIEATLIYHDTLTFAGITDSVKTIGFHAYDRNMNSLDLGINHMTIKISKNYGFVKTFNYYLFPYLLEVYPAEQIEEYTLTGLSAPKAGIQNLTWMDVNDFQAGDELHILEEYSCWNPGGGSAETTKSIYKYLERTDYIDSVAYMYAFTESIDRRWTDSSSFIFSDDTMKVIIKPDPLFDKLPGEPIIDQHMYNYSMANGPILSKTNHRGIETFYPGGDGCWQLLIADGCLTEDKYLKGLGGPYYSCEQAFCLGSSERKLVYYKKGEETWGNPLVISDVTSIQPVKKVNIYPNPADDYLTVSFENVKSSNTVYIYDLQGRLQQSEKLELNSSRINISDLLPGIYILKFLVDDRILKYDKIIVK